VVDSVAMIGNEIVHGDDLTRVLKPEQCAGGLCRFPAGERRAHLAPGKLLIRRLASRLTRSG
jgi:hypothetical protein